MQNAVTPLLITHATAGGIMLLSGIVAMVARKANSYHRLAGKTYFYATCIVGLTGFTIAVLKSNHFLTGVSIFVLFMVVSAYRSLYLKQLYKVKKATPLDWVILVFASLASVFLIGLGIMTVKGGNQFGFTSIVFGGICLLFTIRDIRKFVQGPNDKKHWLYNHISGMIGSYIAGVTAFLAVNVPYINRNIELMVWLGPTLIGTPLIIYWIRKYKTKPADLKQELGLKINAIEA